MSESYVPMGPAAGPPVAAEQASTAKHHAPRRILGIQPVLFVGIVALCIVTVLTIVLIFAGDIQTQAPRVGWTIVAFLAFTALLALDLHLARRSPVPLLIGIGANIYLLGLLMIATWVDQRAGSDESAVSIGFRLFSVYVGAAVGVRAAWAAAWGIIAVGTRAAAAMALIGSRVAAALLGLAAVLLTLRFAYDAFGVTASPLYWQLTVSVLVIAALASCITVLLFWNRRNLEHDERKAAGAAAWPGPGDGAPTSNPSTPWPGYPPPG